MTGAVPGVLAAPGEIMPGVQATDLLHVLESAAAIGAVTTIIGVIALRALARSSIGSMLALIAAVTVVTSIAGVGGITVIMVGNAQDREVMLELIAIAGLAGFAVAMLISRKLTKASRAAPHLRAEGRRHRPVYSPLGAVARRAGRAVRWPGRRA